MSHTGDLVLGHQGQDGTSDRALALKIGVSSTLVGRLKRGDYVELPKREMLAALALQLGIDLKRVVDAALLDTYYLQGGEHGGDTAATSTPGETPGTVTKLPRRGQDLDHEAARDVSRESRADRGRRQQDTAGEPPADDPSDVEPR